MKIKFYRSATIGIDLKGFKVLMDPWLTDGEYFGSWSHYPYYDLDKNLEEINSYNAIYISHIHPDHCSDNTLKKINKNIPIYIHNYHRRYLKVKLENFGFKVKEVNGHDIIALQSVLSELPFNTDNPNISETSIEGICLLNPELMLMMSLLSEYS